MGNSLCVKNKIIGEGKPIVCVPIMEKSIDAIIAKASEMVADEVEMIEWRVDAFEQADNLNAVREVLERLEPLVKNTILVYTFRSKNQGGLMSLTQEQIFDLHEIAVERKVADFVDIELFEAKNAAREIYKLQEKGVHVIASHHDFEETPSRDILDMILNKMRESGAAVVKLAVMPKNFSDVITLLDETNRFHTEYPNQPLVTMSMGSMGCISRVAGEAFGSCITFGAFDKASAPGQLPADELEQVLSILHKSMGE